MKEGNKREVGDASINDGIKGVGYLALATAVALFQFNVYTKGNIGIIDRAADNIVRVFHKRSLPEEPVSKSLNLEGIIADGANNLVKISSATGEGCGVLVNPYEIYTANHVVADAFKGGEDIYIQSPSYLGSSKSIAIRLDSLNYRFNTECDIARITLDYPVMDAARLVMQPVKEFEYYDNIISIAYKDDVIYNQLGEVKSSMKGGQYFIGSINVGPGISGSPVFNEKGQLLGITSMMIGNAASSKYDNGPIIFTNINNPLTNR